MLTLKRFTTSSAGRSPVETCDSLMYQSVVNHSKVTHLNFHLLFAFSQRKYLVKLILLSLPINIFIKHI